MFPTLFSFGPFTVYTLNVLVTIGLILSIFFYWKRAHTEHYEDDLLFDGVLISFLGAVIGARLGYILFHLNEFGLNFFNWLSIFSKPGLNETVGMLTGLLFLAWHARRKKWDQFEVLDFAAIAICFFFVWVWLGRFLAGSHVGHPTSLPVGVTFPNNFDQRHPVQLYAAALFIFLFSVLKFFEHRYRFFHWYRVNKQSAQAGFIVGLFLIGFGLIQFGLHFAKLPEMTILGVGIDMLVGVLIAIVGMFTIYVRSGKWKSSKRRGAGLTAGQTRADSVFKNFRSRLKKNVQE